MQDFITLEACFSAPFPKSSPVKSKAYAEFDQHVERHQQTENILAPRIVDQASTAMKAPPGGSAS